MNFLDNRKNRTITIVCCLIAIICGYLIQNDALFRMMSSDSAKPIGQFERLEKDVRKKNIANYFWEDLKLRDQLTAGDSIFTGSDSSVTVKLYGGQSIAVAPNSLIKFRTKNKKLVIDIPYGAVELGSVVDDIVISDCGQDYNLAQGKDTVVLKKSEKCGSVTVDTRSADMSKDFRAKKTKKNFKDSFLEAAVSVIPTERTVAAISEPDLTPPQFENLDIKFSLAQGKSPWLKWQPVQQAQSYEVEISETPDFAQVQKLQAANPQIKLKNVNSNVFFRGRSKGRNELVSRYSETGKIQIAFPRIKIKQPKIFKDYKAKNPQDKGSKENFNVSWSEVPTAEKYVVEVKDTQSSKVINKVTSRSPASVIEVPQTGKFSYQVHALDSKGRQVSSSDVGQVLYNKVFSIVAPIISSSSVDKFYFFQKNAARYVWLNWIPQGEESHFRVEIAKDPEFTTVIKSALTNKKKLLVTDQVQEGDYFWRVRIEDKDQYSDWSNTEMFRIKINSNSSN